MTRVLVALALATWLAGCNGGGRDGCDFHGRHFAAGDQFSFACNQCTCMADGTVPCTAVFCGQPIDASPSSCTPSAGCDGFGPLCNSICCNAGERCVNGQCVCGNGSDCGDIDHCSGPAMQNDCGTTCCGGSGPCPL